MNAPHDDSRSPIDARAHGATDDAPTAPGGASSRWRERALLVAGGIAAGAVIGLAGGASQSEPPSSETPVEAAAPANERVTLPGELAERAGIRVERVTAAPILDAIEVVGSVAFDPAHVSDIGARVEGRVAEVFVELGDRVDAGDPLVRVETAALGEAVANLLSARAELQAARSHVERERNLQTAQLSTASTVERAAAEVGALQARVRGAEQVLFAMGVTHGELGRAARGGRLDSITLRAPIAGEIVERPPMLGQVVAPTHPVMRLAALEQVWVQLNVYERDLPRVRVGNEAEIVGDDGEEHAALRGTVQHVGATVDPETRTAEVRIEVSNEERRLRPGQFVRARLTRTEGARTGITIPRDAVLQIGGGPAVFSEVAPGEYELRALEIGASVGDRVEVLAGIAEGDMVVVSGGFALKSELQR